MFYTKARFLFHHTYTDSLNDNTVSLLCPTPEKRSSGLRGRSKKFSGSSVRKYSSFTSHGPGQLWSVVQHLPVLLESPPCQIRLVPFFFFFFVACQFPPGGNVKRVRQLMSGASVKDMGKRVCARL